MTSHFLVRIIRFVAERQRQRKWWKTQYEARILDTTTVRPFGIMSITRFHPNEGRSRHWTLTRSRCRWQPDCWLGVRGSSCQWSYSYYRHHVYRQASHWKHHCSPSIPRQRNVPRAYPRVFSSRRARWSRTRGRWSARFRHDSSSSPRAEAIEREPRRGNHRNKTWTMWAILAGYVGFEVHRDTKRFGPAGYHGHFNCTVVLPKIGR